MTISNLMLLKRTALIIEDVRYDVISLTLKIIFFNKNKINDLRK